MTSKYIKLRLLEYYRFKRNMLVGTEVAVARGLADILAITFDLKSSYEIEIKISISDLKADFKYKEAKHFMMEGEDKYHMAPNYFLFAFPIDILGKATQYLSSKNNKYGIIVIDDEGVVKIIKKPKKLNISNNSKLMHYLNLRICNELITSLQTIENSFIKKPIDFH